MTNNTMTHNGINTIQEQLEELRESLQVTEKKLEMVSWKNRHDVRVYAKRIDINHGNMDKGLCTVICDVCAINNGSMVFEVPFDIDTLHYNVEGVDFKSVKSVYALLNDLNRFFTSEEGKNMVCDSMESTFTIMVSSYQVLEDLWIKGVAQNEA